MEYVNYFKNYFYDNNDQKNNLELLNYDIYYKVCFFLNNKELGNLQIGYNDKELFLAAKNLKEKNRKVTLRFFNKLILYNSVYSYFENTFFPMKVISKLPVLPYKNYFALGDYIDNIKYKDMKKPIMIGIDFWKRPFICIRYKYFIKNKKKKHVLIVFQRFKGVKSNWVKSGHNAGPILHFSACLLSNDEQKILIKNICQLLSKEKVTTKFRSNGIHNDHVFHNINCIL